MAMLPRPKSPAGSSGARMYAAARNSRLTGGWNSPNGSADSELRTSLMQLRTRSRQLIRDNSYAKRAKIVVINNVIGTGIGFQARVENQRGKLIDVVNDDIEATHEEWSRAENCHTGGKLCFADMERQIMGQIFEAGEIFVRKHYRPFGSSPIPLALELIEAERVAEEYQTFQGLASIVHMGIEQDPFGRALAIWVRRIHPSELVSYTDSVTPNQLFRVPAEQMYHLHTVDRWPQSRGEPWLHTAARRLNDMDGYSEAEIVAARGAASYMGIIESADPGSALTDEPIGTDGQPPEFDLEPGAVERLAPGEKFELVSPNRPNPAMDGFMRLMLREVAAGANVSYESISRDYSQSNYSSSRLSLLEDRDVWRVLQQWFIRSFRAELHREWLQAAVLSRAIKSIDVTEYALNRRKFEAVTWKPRGWSYVNPKEDVEAQKSAVRSGFTTNTQVVAEFGNGRDIWDILKERKAELEMMQTLGLTFDTDPAVILARGEKVAVGEDAALSAEGDTNVPTNTAPQPKPGDQATPGRVIPMRTQP